MILINEMCERFVIARALPVKFAIAASSAERWVKVQTRHYLCIR